MDRDRARQAIAAANLDALVASSPESSYYVSGSQILTQRLLPTRLGLLLLTPDGDASFVLCSIEEAQARAESWITDLRLYTEFADSPVQWLADVIREKGLARGRIGFEARHLAAEYYLELKQALPDATLVPADAVFDRLRVIKSPAEIEILEQAAAGTDRAIRRAFEQARPGDTELKVVDDLVQGIRKEGAESVAFTVLATGPINANMVHPFPSDTRIESGQVLRTDSGGYFKGYFSDLARTAVGVEASQRQKDDWQKLRTVQERVIDAMKPGVAVCDLYHLCARSFEELGLSFKMPHIGHNIGLHVHENPMVSPQTTDELEPGMVLCIEPVHRSPEGLMHIEDTVLVTERGVRILSRTADWDNLFVIR